MRVVVWTCVGALLGVRSWRNALGDIASLRRGSLTFHDAHFTETPVAVWVSMFMVASSWFGFAHRFDADTVVVVFGLWSAVMARLVFVDIDTHVLPRRTVVPTTLLGLVGLVLATLVTGEGSLTSMLAGSVVAWLVLRVMEWASRGDLGGGDVSLGPVLGMFVGWGGFDRVFTMFIVAFVVAGSVVILLWAFGRVGRRTHIAFGPFLIVGAMAGVLR